MRSWDIKLREVINMKHNMNRQQFRQYMCRIVHDNNEARRQRERVRIASTTLVFVSLTGGFVLELLNLFNM